MDLYYTKNLDNNIKLPSRIWQAIHSEITVLDPDGWDRKNYDYSWNIEEISLREYVKRLFISTTLRGV